MVLNKHVETAPKNNVKKEGWVQDKKPVILSACKLPEVQRHLGKGLWLSLLLLVEMKL